MNNVTLSGRITKEPVLRYLQGTNNAIVRFNIAVDKNLTKDKKEELESKNQPTADFINIVAWGNLAENIAKYTGKGLRVLVHGRIQTGSYEKDGQRIYTTDIQASNVEFLDWKDTLSNTNYSQDTFTPPIDDDFEYQADFDPTEDRRIPF
ncbi:single-stranded DNA-binding protein [Helcococcus kunzii]|uniref:single-stranded DNA-binding protein n=1 Tax=Helcococcus kunzii TaxID=40091 RepID=UPI0038A84CBC